MIKVNYDKNTGKVFAFNKNIEPFIEITEEERRQPLPHRHSYYAVVDGKFTIVEEKLTKAEMAKEKIIAAHKRIIEIEKWLKDNDWKVNKVYLGEWSNTDPRWLEYLQTRSAIRAERDALESEVAEWTS